MRKRSLAMMVVATMALPAQALAEFCFEDNYDGRYSIEIVSQQGAKVLIQGFRQVGNGCLENVNGVEPLTGEITLIDSQLAAGGFHVNAAEPSEGCYSFRMNVAIDLTNGELFGEFHNDDGDTGEIGLQLSSCPDPGEDPNVTALAAVGPDRKSN